MNEKASGRRMIHLSGSNELSNLNISCGRMKGPPARKPLILTAALITVLLFLGLGPIGDLPQRTRYASAMAPGLMSRAIARPRTPLPGMSIRNWFIVPVSGGFSYE